MLVASLVYNLMTHHSFLINSKLISLSQQKSPVICRNDMRHFLSEVHPFLICLPVYINGAYLVRAISLSYIGPKLNSYRKSLKHQWPCMLVLALPFFLWPCDAIWRHRSGSTLAQVMACCLTAPSHYLYQCWLFIKVLWDNYFKAISQEMHMNLTHCYLVTSYGGTEFVPEPVDSSSKVFCGSHFRAIPQKSALELNPWYVFEVYSFGITTTSPRITVN